MHFQFMAAIFDFSLPVTSDRTENMDDMSSELSDLGNIVIAIGILTIHSMQANLQFTSGLAAAILD